MNPELLELERTVANLKADIAILDNAVGSLKERNERYDQSIHDANAQIMDLKLTINNQFNEVNSEVVGIQNDITRVKEDMDKLSTCVHNIESKVDKVTNNSLLEFTSELDVKKITTIIVIAFSFISSPSLISSYLSNQSLDTDSQKLDRLIELLEEQPRLPSTFENNNNYARNKRSL